MNLLDPLDQNASTGLVNRWPEEPAQDEIRTVLLRLLLELEVPT